MHVRHLVALSLGLALGLTTAASTVPGAHADMAAHERAERQKRARLAQLNDLLIEAMAVAPTSFEDPAAVRVAADRIAKLADTVRRELAGPTFSSAASTRAKVQLNLNKVDDRLKAVQLTARTAAVLARIAPIAKAHGEPPAADLAEADRLVRALLDRRGAYKDGADAMLRWHRALEAKLAEVPWPKDLAPLEVSRGGLAQAFVPVNATVAGARPQPIALLEVTSRIDELDRHGAAFRGLRFELWGPVVEKDGLVSGAMKARDWKELAPGTYLLWAKGAGPSTAFRILLSSPETPRERFLQVGSIAPDATVAQRRADAIYPFLGALRAAHARQKLFLLAPREAFVYAADDLVAKDTENITDEGPFPTKDEPLLVVGNGEYNRGLRVINAEGLEWILRDTTRLAAAPSGAPALPARIRPLDLEFSPEELDGQERFTSFEGTAHAPILKKYAAVVETWNTCVDKVLAKYGGTAANNLAVVTYRGGKVARVQHLKDKAWDEADRTCKTKQYEARMAAFDKQLSQLHAEERARRLDEIRAAWQR